MKTLKFILILLNSLLAITAIAGGIALVAGWNTPPAEMLSGSLFRSFTIPGLSLTFFVGGSALAAALLLIRKSSLGPLFSAAAGIVIIVFEFIEVMIIGSPPGVERTLQIFYFSLGLLISILSLIELLILLLKQKSEVF